MPRYAGGATAIIDAPTERVFALMLDYDRLPQWQRAVKRIEVLSNDSEGRGLEVAYEIDVRVGVVRYTLRHRYEAPRRISSVYVKGDFRDCQGEWTFAGRPDGSTEAAFSLRIDPGRIIPAPVVRMLNRRVMKGSLEDLRRYFADGG